MGAKEGQSAGEAFGSDTAALPAHQHGMGAHVHSLNDSGQAALSLAGSTVDAWRHFRMVPSNNEAGTHHVSNIPTPANAQGRISHAIALSGITGAMTAPTNTSNPTADHEISTVQRSISIHVWRRIK